MNWIKGFFKKVAGFFPLPFRMPFGMGGWYSFLRRASVQDDPIGGYAGWVYAALSKRAKRMGAIELKLYQMARNGDLTEIMDSELLALMYRANPIQSKYQFFYTLEMFLGIWGSAPILLDRQGGRAIQYLWPLRPDLLKMIPNDNGEITGYEYRVGQKVLNFAAEDVVLINEPNPANILIGMSPMQAGALEIDTDMAAAIWNKALLENWAEPGGVLYTEQTLNDASFERVKKDWGERRAGPLNAGRTAVLEKGLRYEAVGRSPKEMDHVESRKFNRNAISVILGVPMALMTSEDVNLANAEVAERVFAKDTVQPQYELVTSVFNEFVVPLFDPNQWLSYESPVPDDVQMKINLATAGVDKWLTVNEGREMFNLEPLEGGDAIFKPIGLMPQVGEGVQPALPADPTQQQAGMRYRELTKGDVVRDSKLHRSIKQAIYARTYRQRKVVEGMTEKILAKLVGNAKGDKVILKIKGAKLKTDESKN